MEIKRITTQKTSLQEKQQAARTAQTEAMQELVKTEEMISPTAEERRQQERLDKLTLSQNALAYMKELGQQIREQNQLNRQQAKKEAEHLKAAQDVQKKCQLIAARIRAGDNVPPEDMRYLLKHDSREYQLAMIARKKKEDPKNWDSVLKPEDKKLEENNARDSMFRTLSTSGSTAQSKAIAVPRDSGGGETSAE